MVRAQDVKTLREMFPGTPESEARRILAANDGNVENAINALLTSL